MLDKEFIKSKIELIQRDLERAQDLKGYTINEIVKDFYKWSALKMILVEIIGRAIDINSHIIAEQGSLKEKAPSTSRETFLRIGEIGVMPKDFVEIIAQSAGFRNKIIHEYNELEKEKVYKTVDEALEQYTNYCKYILNYIESK